MTVRDFTFNRIIPVIVYGGMFVIALAFVISLAEFNLEEEQKAFVPAYVDPHPYETADRYVEQGTLGKALATYTEIINDDDEGAEEDAWHEKGKILNRLGYCNDAVNHYANYMDRFPDSIRAVEGYDLAKRC